MILRNEKFHEYEIVTWTSEGSEDLGFGYNILELADSGRWITIEKNWDFDSEEAAMEAAKDLIARGGLE